MSNEDNLYREYGDLVRRYKGGDTNAYEEIYEKSKRLVYMTCNGILGNAEDAKDAMQDTYLTVYTKINDLGDEDKFLGWLKRVAATKALDMYRRKKGDVSYEDAIESDEAIVGDDNLETLPDAYIMEKAKRDTLNNIIRKELSDVQYQTVILYYYNEFPVELIAKMMNCPEGTVKTRLKAARVKIKAAVTEYEGKSHEPIGLLAGVPFLTRLFIETSKFLNVPPVTLITKVPAGQTAAGRTAAHGTRAAAAVRNGAVHGAKTAARVGFLSTTAGKIAAGAVIVAVLGTVGVVTAKVVSDHSNNSHRKSRAHYEEEETEEIEETEVMSSESEPQESVPQASESTAESEESTLIIDPEPGEVPLEDVPELEQLNAFLDSWFTHDYNCASPEEYLIQHLIMGDGPMELNFGMYFDGFEMERGIQDPEGALISQNCYKIEMEKLIWTEKNILNLSDADIERVNNYMDTDLADIDENWGHYIADDGYLYFTKGDAGYSWVEYPISVTYDGQYYYVTTNCYDDMETAWNPDFDPMTDGDNYLYTMELKEIDGKAYWTIIKCEPADPSQGNGSDVEDLSSDGTIVDPENVDFSTLEDNGWKDAYLTKASSITKDDFNDGNVAFPDDYEVHYDLVFINSDTIPELVCCVDNVGGDSWINVYTYADGEVVMLGHSFYRYKIDVTYVPAGNLICEGGAMSGAGSVVSSMYLCMDDDCKTLYELEITSARYDMDKYTSVDEAVAAGEYDDDVWYTYLWDSRTQTSTPMPEEEGNALSEQIKKSKTLYTTKSYDELVAMMG